MTCPNVLNYRTKICIIGRVALLVMLEADKSLSMLDMKEQLLYSKYMQILGLVIIGCELQSPKVTSFV